MTKSDDKLIRVAEGILDAKEYRDENLKTVGAVQAYAENGMGISLTDSEALRVLNVCLTVLSRQAAGEILSTQDIFYDIDEKLRGVQND